MPAPATARGKGEEGRGGRGERRKSSIPCSQMEWAAGHPTTNIHISQKEEYGAGHSLLCQKTTGMSWWRYHRQVDVLRNKIPSSASLLHRFLCFPDFLPSLARVSFFQNQLHEFFFSDLSVFYSKHRKVSTGIVFSNIKPESSNKTINVFEKTGSDFSIFLFISYFSKLLECAWLRPALP